MTLDSRIGGLGDAQRQLPARCPRQPPNTNPDLDRVDIRDAKAADFAAIIRLNAAEELQTSSMDAERLRTLHDLSCCHRVALVQGEIAGFLIAMRESARYRNDNFSWFACRYPKFLYIDRIVVSGEFTGMKIGTSLYRNLFAFARLNGVLDVVCEYNIEPPNPASKAFHDRWGFMEVGTRRVANGSKWVSLQAARI